MRLPRLARIRAALLFACLIAVGGTAVHQHVQTRGWTEPLDIVLYPLNGDGRPATDRYIESLSRDVFAGIEQWGMREAQRHDLPLERPLTVSLGPAIGTLPPAFPSKPGRLGVLAWGLRFRWWVWQHTPDRGDLTRVRVFVVYHQGSEGVALAHSLGMSRGLLGLVHAFALPEQNAQNNIVIAHEVLHTVGATDKYGRDGTPVFPQGYADARRQPLHPQRQAEIMAGRVPRAGDRSRMAENLGAVIVNEWTAAEINWLD